MSKRIIFCADGTWDTAQNATNVYKLYKSIATASDQVAFYDDGVGSDGTPIEKILGGAMGEGLFQKIKNGYTKIAHVYETGDEIFLFGFSRGAFTARCIAGMIANCGLPTGAFEDSLIEEAFSAYRNPNQRTALTIKYAMFNPKITMVGVWDTVGSLGIPALFGQVDPIRYGFLDTSLHANVLNACHALSIDERRQEFPPTLWTPPATAVPGQTLEQVWFSGVHCDVGGGYPETGLSDVAFSWMLGKALNLGLEVDPKVAAQYTTLDAKFALDQIHESWNMVWGFPRPRALPKNAVLSNSVSIRCEYLTGYKPQNFGLTNALPDASYSLVQVVRLPPV